MMNIKLWVAVIVSLMLSGCITGMKTHLGGDEQFMKNQIDAMKNEMSNTLASFSKTQTDNSTKSVGSGIMNDPKMIEKLALYGVIAIVSPFILIILGFVVIIIIIVFSNGKKYKEVMTLLRLVIKEMGETSDKLIDKE